MASSQLEGVGSGDQRPHLHPYVQHALADITCQPLRHSAEGFLLLEPAVPTHQHARRAPERISHPQSNLSQ